METLNETLKIMEKYGFVISRALPSGDTYLIEFKYEDEEGE